MKIVNKIITLLVLVVTTLCVFALLNLKNVSAASLGAGDSVAVSGVSGNLNNINIKVEFTTSVNLDGTNNALLVGLAAEDGTILSDNKFIAAQTNAGLFDKNDIAVMFDVVPGAIGTKTAVESNFKYSFETRDFKVVDATKNIAKIVVIAQKGEEIDASFTFAEVKYSVKFGDETAVEYSYNAVIAGPASTPTVKFDLSGHQAVNGWKGDDASSFVSGTSKATKDIVYSLDLGEKENHNWENVSEKAATTTEAGNVAHQTCTCGAKRIDASSTELAKESDIVIPALSHTHTYVGTVDWTGATTPGAKPAVTFTCSDTTCNDVHVMDAADVTVEEKADSRQNSTCAVKGSVIYVVTCSYQGANVNEEKSYELELAAHTLGEHVEAKANSLEEDGCIEHWTCSVCNGIFLDSALTQPATLAEVTIPHYVLEEAQVVSVKDLAGGATAIGLNNSSYTYELTKTYKSTSLQFKWNIVENGTDADRLRIHNYFLASDVWNDTCAAWYVTNGNAGAIKNAAGAYPFKSHAMTVGLHTIEFRVQAILNGETPTGDYLLTQLFDGDIVDQCVKAFNVDDMTGKVFINSSGTKNHLYDISVTESPYKAPVEITVSDLGNLGILSGINSTTTYSYNATTDHFSRIIKYTLVLNEKAEGSEFVCSLGEEKSCRLWLQGNKYDKLFFAWQVAGRPTDGYYIGGNKNNSLEVGKEYQIEMARIVISDSLDLIYIKVDGKYLYTSTDKNGNPSGTASIFFVNSKATDSNPITKNQVSFLTKNYTVKDFDYKAPEFEEADIISVNDLRLAGTYQSGQIQALSNNVYNYDQTTQYGSVIFKGVFNFAAADFSEGNTGPQFRFNAPYKENPTDNDSKWDNTGMVWFHYSVGTLIPNPAGSYFIGSKLAKDKDVNVEIGRLAVMKDGVFTGKHYFYVKYDGALVIDYVAENIRPAAYAEGVVFITGNVASDDSYIKNVAINKTVTLKVGDKQTTVNVVKSGLLEIPTLSEEILPQGKRITGWTIEGTETAFDFETRITKDITLVATVVTDAWKVTFGTEVTYVNAGEEIVAPAGPAKAFDIDNHYTFNCWEDANHEAFVAGTLADKEYTFTAKYDSEAHNWTPVAEVAATIQAPGVKAHLECTCGAKKLEETSTELATADDLRIAQLDHTHTFVASVDWTEATNPGDKPVVEYKCTCGEHHTMDAADLTVEEKADSRENPDCTNDGCVTFVVSCEYEEVQASFEHEYTLTHLGHSLTHHDAVDSTFEATGNVEYWSCSRCEKFFADEDCTDELTQEELVLPVLTLEEAQVISVSDLVPGATQLILSNEKYQRTFTKEYHSTSLEFKFEINATVDGNRVRFHNFVGLEKEGKTDGWWISKNSAWFVVDQNKVGVHSTVADDFAWGQDAGLSKGLHTIKFMTQAILCGEQATGEYLISVYVDDKLVKQVTNTYDETRINKSWVYINGSSTWNTLYDINYDPEAEVLEEAQIVNISDLNSSGRIINKNSYTRFSYAGSDTNYSRIIKFNLCLNDETNNELVVDLGGQYNCCLWFQGNNTKNFFFAWELDGHKKASYFLDGKGNAGLDAGINYEIEIGRIRVLEGFNAGKDLVYLKVDGEYLTNTSDTAYSSSWFYVNPNVKDGNKDISRPIVKNEVGVKVIGYELTDVNYEEPEFEEADIISVNDLCQNGTYMNGQMDLMENRVVTYHKTSEYGSVIFKGVFNFSKDNYNNGDKNGTQIRFINSWIENRGMIWFNGSAGVLIVNEAGGYYFADNIATGKDVEIEIGRLAIMEDGEFAGKHYFYVKADGEIVNECIISGIGEEIYSLNEMFFTGKPVLEDNPETEANEASQGNTGNIIKNVEIEKTVTIKVGESSQQITVLQSGLVEINISEITPAGKTITAWTIEGTETKFNILADRVFEDLVLVATVENHKFSVKFGTEELFFEDNAEITAPEENPTKASDATNHYAFAKWVDAEGQEFVAGTLATADMVFTADFTATPHAFGDWVVDTDATCSEFGSKHRTCTCGYEETVEIAPHHSPVHHDAQAPTCTADGTIEYWSCSGCELLFSDAACTQAITSTVDPAHHNFVHHEAQASTCTAHGTIEYWSCSGCELLFADAEGSEVITSTEAPLAAHSLTHVSAKAADCTHTGNKEYWVCSECSTKFADEACTTVITDVTLPISHNAHKVSAVAPTCEEDGNIEHWICDDCNKRFSDAACTQEIKDASQIVVAATGHKFENGKCTECGAADPDYKAPTKKVGCFSTVGASSIICLLGLAALVIKRRKESEINIEDLK